MESRCCLAAAHDVDVLIRSRQNPSCIGPLLDKSLLAIGENEAVEITANSTAEFSGEASAKNAYSRG